MPVQTVSNVSRIQVLAKKRASTRPSSSKRSQSLVVRAEETKTTAVKVTALVASMNNFECVGKIEARSIGLNKSHARLFLSAILFHGLLFRDSRLCIVCARAKEKKSISMDRKDIV